MKSINLRSGKGKNNPPMRDGGVSNCVCPTCGFTISHYRGTPCINQVCPKCGVEMEGL